MANSINLWNRVDQSAEPFTMFKTYLILSLFTLLAWVGIFPTTEGKNLTIDQPGFEKVGAWKRSDTGEKSENFYRWKDPSIVNKVDEIPNGCDRLAFSNGKPGQLIYQVLNSTLAPNTAYTLSIIALDHSDKDFSPFEMRLGFMPDESEAKNNEGSQNHFFGKHLLKSAERVHPAPTNGDAKDDGYRQWTTTFITKERPSGLGRPLRIEIVGRGIQSLYDNVRLEAHPLPVVAMLGDSTTDQGLPWVVKKDLDARIKQLLERPTMINAGRGGDTATGALKRLNEDVLAHKPDVVTVSFGLNDTGRRNPKLYGESLRKIVETLKKAGVKVILMTSTPFNNKRHFWGKKEEFQKLGGLDEYMNREFCEQVRKLAKEQSLPLCDLHKIFHAEFAKNPEAINTLISPDGVHLTGDGLKKMSEHLTPMIEKLLKKPKNEGTSLPIDQRGRLNLCAAPYFADPTGKRDSTEAILRALDDVTSLTRRSFQRTLEEMAKLPETGFHRHPESAENHRVDGAIHCSTSLDLPYLPVLYFPEGTYRVSDTLRYRHQDLQNTYGSEMNQQIRIRGDGTGRTVIRLIDNAPGFGKGMRKPVLSFMAAKQTNVATSNYCEDLTIHTGKGNPGAVGLDFFANNSGAVRNVNIISDDGSGFAGLQLGHANYSGILLKHIKVKGFDHGLHIDSATGGMFAHAEDISVSEQRVSGVTVGATSLSLRKLRTRSVPAALTTIDPVGFTALIDSELEGTGPRGIDRKSGALYVSKTKLIGFKDQRIIDEWVYPEAFGAKGDKGMPRLVIQETPIYSPKNKTSTGVRKFGARGDGLTDDSAAIQAAMSFGAQGVFFEPGRYLINRPVVIPSSVEHLDFQFCDLVAGPDLKQSEKEGFLIKGGDASTSPLFVERLLAWEKWHGKHCTFTHATTRTVCFKDIQTQRLRFYQNTVSGGQVFFDNVATTTGVEPGSHGHNICAISIKGQKVWARQLNPERGEPAILNDGSDFVLMGFKSEGKGVVVHTINGGRTEVIGGVVNVGNTADTAFIAEDSEIRLSTATHGWREPAYFRNALRHSRGNKITLLKSSEFPSRGFEKTRGPQYLVPLYK